MPYGQLTWGEMKRRYEGISDNAVIITRTSNSMELGNAMVDAHTLVNKMKIEKKHCRDAFDGTHYTTDVYVNTHYDDKDGIDVIYVGG